MRFNETLPFISDRYFTLKLNDEKDVDINLYKKLSRIMHYTFNYSKDIYDLLNHYNSISLFNMSNSDIYGELCWIIYNSGFKYEIIKKFWPDIVKEFYYFDVEQVSKLNNDVHNNALNICEKINFYNIKKAKWCIYNAKRILELDEEKKECNGFKGYLIELSKIELISLINDISNIIKELRFKGIGEITVFHFLKNIGIDIYKPDRHIIRLFEKMGILHDSNDIQEVTKGFLKISDYTNFSIRELDTILFEFGRITNDAKHIML